MVVLFSVGFGTRQQTSVVSFVMTMLKPWSHSGLCYISRRSALYIEHTSGYS